MACDHPAIAIGHQDRLDGPAFWQCSRIFRQPRVSYWRSTPLCPNLAGDRIGRGCNHEFLAAAADQERAMILCGRHSDRTGERAGHIAIGYAVGATGLIARGLMTDPVMTMAMLAVAAMGQSSTGPFFWSLP